MMKHEYPIEVRGYELDSFNHVNNAVYVNYIEAARWAFFKDNNWLDSMMNAGLLLVVIETNIRYINELKIFDKAIVRSKWHYDGNYLIADQNIYKEETNQKVVKSTVKLIFVSTDRIIQELPEFIKNELDNGVAV